MYCIFFSSYRQEDQKPEHGPYLPIQLSQLYENSLMNLVGCGKLEENFCSEEVFKKIRLKFTNAIAHSKKKKVSK